MGKKEVFWEPLDTGDSVSYTTTRNWSLSSLIVCSQAGTSLLSSDLPWNLKPCQPSKSA